MRTNLTIPNSLQPSSLLVTIINAVSRILLIDQYRMALFTPTRGQAEIITKVWDLLYIQAWELIDDYIRLLPSIASCAMLSTTIHNTVTL